MFTVQCCSPREQFYLSPVLVVTVMYLAFFNISVLDVDCRPHSLYSKIAILFICMDLSLRTADICNVYMFMAFVH